MTIGGAPGVYVQEFESGAKPIEGVGTSTVGFVGMTERIEKDDFNNDDLLDKPTFISSWGDFKSKYGIYDEEKAPYLAPAVYGFFQNGGGKCYVVRVKDGAGDGDYVGSDGGLGNKTGLTSFEEVDEVNIVCIPGITSQTVQQAMMSHCQNMKDRFCILDSEENADMDAIKAHKENIISDTGIAALYYPWIKVPVEKGKNGDRKKPELKPMFMPPSGYIAGIYARSDTERGVHKAPANEIIRGAQEIKFTITEGEQDSLNPLGINCIRSFKERGIRVWGARTTAPKGNLWKYINVRRLFLYMEESIDEGTQWVVFEPNNYKLWGRVVATITNFLTTVWRDGALMGKTPEQAFYVKCDRTTMTQDDIDNGKLICEIGVAPVKPAEFVIFRITQWTEGLENE